MQPIRTNFAGVWFLGLFVAAFGAVGAKAQRPDLASAGPTITNAQAAGHRLWIFVFDVSSMSATELPRARHAATSWIAESMAGKDLVSVVSVGETLTLLQNFTASPDRAQAAVNRVVIPISSTGGPNERDYFNNDLRFRALRTVCTGLQAVEQKKAIMFFTALRPRPGSDNQAEARAATEACNRAHASINPIDIGPVHVGG